LKIFFEVQIKKTRQEWRMAACPLLPQKRERAK